ncbi:MAG: hypothetical protein ACO1TE_09920 [Prosthecobacter sp.]
MTATIAANGFIEIPSVFRKTDSVQDGQTFDIERVARGEYRLKARDDKAAQGEESWLDILLACPVKDWYEPMENEQTTDDLKEGCFE